MNTARNLLCLVAVLVLAACASSGNQLATRHSASEYDQAYIDAVESASKVAGVRVVWVNPPKADEQE